MNRRNVQKINIFWFNCPFSGGVTKLEAFHWCFVTKLNTPKPSPFCGKLKIFSDFCYISELSGTFLKSLIHFGIIWDIYISKNLEPPSFT